MADSWSSASSAATTLEKGSEETANGSHAAAVAHHYNAIGQGSIAGRAKSRIFYMRNFNNWIKSELISEYTTRLKVAAGSDRGRESGLRVLDLGAGKGGDMLKWREARVQQVIFVDIADVSVEHCRARYLEMLQRRKAERHGGRGGCFEAEFLVADCTRNLLSERFSNPRQRFELVSCQFCFHYCFESLPQTEVMLRNAAELLTPGGYLLLTLPDANELVRRLRAAKATHFGNDVYQVRFPEGASKQHLALFGARYNFQLQDVVDCPEFLVHLPVLEHLAAQWGLRKVKSVNFADYFAERVAQPGSRALLGRMQSLEPYPPASNVHPMGGSESDQYETARRQMQHLQELHPEQRHSLGTLSKDEWEAVTLYNVVVFQREGD